MDLYNASNGSEEAEEVLLTLEEYEAAKKDLTKIIATAEAARRLAENEDFILLVMEGYFEDHPKRMAGLMSSGKINQATFDNCGKEIDAVGRFRRYMQEYTDQGNLAEDELKALELAREEAILIEAGEIQK